jgi:catechol 2,3-dioxygenase-like lactoylglutathione lyase family enzyme
MRISGFDHLYIAVSDMQRAEQFYDRVFLTLGFRRNQFTIGGDSHIQYYNREFGYVIRPARDQQVHSAYAPGLHHLCLRTDSIDDVHACAKALRAAGVEVSDPKLYPEYAEDYVAIFFSDPDGLRLEITNYRKERRERNERWDESGFAG